MDPTPNLVLFGKGNSLTCWPRRMGSGEMGAAVIAGDEKWTDNVHVLPGPDDPYGDNHVRVEGLRAVPGGKRVIVLGTLDEIIAPIAPLGDLPRQIDTRVAIFVVVDFELGHAGGSPL